MSRAWATPIRLNQLAATALTIRLEPDAAERAKAAHDLGLESLPSLTAELSLRRWLDGVEITGRFQAVAIQLCAVTLDPFEQPLEGEVDVRAVPAGSPNAPAPGGEMAYDPEVPDPPDVLAGEAADLAAYVLEHLALAIDPFARKPGATFDYEPPPDESSPFAALRRLKEP
jgi:hypothetical protein